MQLKFRGRCNVEKASKCILNFSLVKIRTFAIFAHHAKIDFTIQGQILASDGNEMTPKEMRSDSQMLDEFFRMRSEDLEFEVEKSTS